jgi:hypothetical protein
LALASASDRNQCAFINTRYDRCAHAFFSAICIAATVIFWLGQ